MKQNWYSKLPAEIFEEIKTTEHGLTEKEALYRLEKFGPNKLPEAKADTLFKIFINQFKSPLIYILMIASVVFFLMHEYADAFIILLILSFNAIVGTFQEGKAQNTLLSLKKFANTSATVLREGKELIVPSEEVVVGDIIILQEGEKIPADARVILSHNLKVDEAVLTGESEPIYKIVEPIKKPKIEITEQKNMIFSGTHISSGSGQALVVATGSKTFIGQIAKEIENIDTEIPLKANIRQLSKMIIVAVVVICISLFIFGIATGKPLKDMFLTMMSLCISVIPAGLPIVMTLVLAAGVWRMSKRNALVKRLQAVEALGQAKIIAVDKTGTVTKNELIVKNIFVNNKIFNVQGVGYDPTGEIILNDKIVNPIDYPELTLIGKISAFCSNARVMFDEENDQWKISGDPTEAAMLIMSKKLGYNKEDLNKKYPLMNEVPFDYKLKYHATVQNMGKEKMLSVVGAPEVIFNRSSKIWENGKGKKLTEEKKKELEKYFIKMSQKGLRIIAVAQKKVKNDEIDKEKLGDLVFVGMLSMSDTLRPEVFDAMNQASLAGIKVVMITGDHKITAQTIAKEAGIYKQGDIVLTGEEMDNLSEEKLAKILDKVTVFARFTPDRKLQIIKAYKAKGIIVAMTGDGVNDAPSLVAADLGVAMGKIGTEVAKEASDIILLDDNFGSIVSAIEEGRSIYKTIKKVVLYLFSTGIGEVLIISAALVMRIPVPILPAQIIWLNFVTDGFLDVALGMEPKEEGLLTKKFSKPKKYLIDKFMSLRIFLMGSTMAIGTIFIFLPRYQQDFYHALTMSFTAMAIFQWFNAWNCRSDEKSIFQVNPFSNKFLLVATPTVVILQLFAIYNPFMQKVLTTTPLNLNDWILIIMVVLSIVLVEETRKFAFKILKKN